MLNFSRSKNLYRQHQWGFTVKDEIICPTGYDLKSGDVGGWGNVNTGQGNRTYDSIDECATMCNNKADCLSFEYEFQQYCNFNNEANPNSNPFQNNLFCSKILEGLAHCANEYQDCYCNGTV